MATAPEVLAHQQWLGILQPEGLVVSAAALHASGVILPGAPAQRDIQLRLEGCVGKIVDDDVESWELPDFELFARDFLGWPMQAIAWAHGDLKVPDDLQSNVEAYQLVIRPSHVLYQDSKPLILVMEEKDCVDFSAKREGDEWDASLVQRMERLLRDTRIAIGILHSKRELRIVYAPAAENSGSLGFPVSEMRDVPGRPIVAALDCLLSKDRVLGPGIPAKYRLPALFIASRESQNSVSDALAEQVLGALYELIKGLQQADQNVKQRLLGDVLKQKPEEIYHALLTLIMRLIFLLYAEDKGVMPQGDLYFRGYSAKGLFLRLQDDFQRHGGNMDKRYGAWAQLLTTFRLVYSGCVHPQMRMPARLGYLFDPARYPFLSADADGKMPLVSDAVIYKVLRLLLVIDGERLSYRSLDVENIGAVYETMMGFSVYQSEGSTVLIGGGMAPAAVELDALLEVKSAERVGKLEEWTGYKASAKNVKAVKEAKDAGELEVALGGVIRRDLTPKALAKGAITLNPGEERRRSGSHYTARELTRPLVGKAFEPHFNRLGEKPRAADILTMTICDPAMGSGAFLVEACRQLSAKVVMAWDDYPEDKPAVPEGESVEFVALRTVAQRCIFGVDRNPMAVDLAKMSMWLLTISKDHPFTFMDHSMKHGDALVGMSKEQIKKFHWDLAEGGENLPALRALDQEIDEAIKARLQLRNLNADETEALQEKLDEANAMLEKAKRAGDLLVYAWFSNDKDKSRIEARNRYADSLVDAIKAESRERKTIEHLRFASKPLAPFHWELEFPEVFADNIKGFAVFVGNPPFAGKNTATAGNVEHYLDYLAEVVTPGSSGMSDLVAHFFTRPFALLKSAGLTGPGTMCLISTKTIRQGNTRESSLALIRKTGGEIYHAQRRVAWPGKAAVVIATIGISKGDSGLTPVIDGKQVNQISSFLINADVDDTPQALTPNLGRSFQGSIVLGMGFTFDDGNPAATSISTMQEILRASPESRPYVKIYVGGEQVNNQPEFKPERYTIDFGEMPPEEASKHEALWDILEVKVKPERALVKREKNRDTWWQFAETRPGLRRAIDGHLRVLVANCQAAKYVTFSFLPSGCVYANSLYVFSDPTYAHFAVVQSRVHEVWARMFGTSLEDRLRYTGTSCYENFPFPPSPPGLEEEGRRFDEERSSKMASLGLGLTPLGNRLNNPDDRSPEIIRLRELHAAMDKAVLDAYGWADILPAYEYSGDYENEDGTPGSVRLNFTEEVRDDILKRLLALHAERLKAEQAKAQTESPKKNKSKKAQSSDDAGQSELF
jgi:hypothetical protein